MALNRNRATSGLVRIRITGMIGFTRNRISHHGVPAQEQRRCNQPVDQVLDHVEHEQAALADVVDRPRRHHEEAAEAEVEAGSAAAG